jgi:hypothetical protein
MTSKISASGEINGEDETFCEAVSPLRSENVKSTARFE